MKPCLFPAVLIVLCGLLSCNAVFAANCERNATQGDYPTRGWGLDVRNTRYQSQTSINRNNVDGLELL